MIFFLRSYLFEREWVRAQTGERGRGREKSRPSLSRKPHRGLDPRTLWSWLELKADGSPTEPHRRPSLHHSWAALSICWQALCVLLDVTDDGAVWSWLFQSVTEEEGLPLAKVSSSVYPRGTNITFWVSFQSNWDEIQTVYSVLANWT